MEDFLIPKSCLRQKPTHNPSCSSSFSWSPFQFPAAWQSLKPTAHACLLAKRDLQRGVDPRRWCATVIAMRNIHRQNRALFILIDKADKGKVPIYLLSKL